MKDKQPHGATPPEKGEHEYPLPRRRGSRVREAVLEFGAHEEARKKNFRLRQSLIDRAVHTLGARSETDAIEQALELVVFRAELMDGVRAMRGAEIVDVFGSGEA
jgi:hypothetical protein